MVENGGEDRGPRGAIRSASLDLQKRRGASSRPKIRVIAYIGEPASGRSRHLISAPARPDPIIRLRSRKAKRTMTKTTAVQPSRRPSAASTSPIRSRSRLRARRRASALRCAASSGLSRRSMRARDCTSVRCWTIPPWPIAELKQLVAEARKRVAKNSFLVRQAQGRQDKWHRKYEASRKARNQAVKAKKPKKEALYQRRMARAKRKGRCMDKARGRRDRVDP